MHIRHLRIGLIVAALAVAVACGDSADTYLTRGDEHFAAGRYREALVEFRNAVKADPSSGVAHYRVAQTIAAGASIGEGVREFARAADLLPDDLGIQLDAARALLATGQFEDARSRAEGVLKRDATNVDAHIVRAHATAGLKDVDEATKALEEAIKLQPERSASYVRLASLQLATGRRAEAEAAYKQAISMAPNVVGPHLALANYYWMSGRPAEAEGAIKAALAAEPNNGKATRALARLYLITGRTAEAEGPLRAVADSGVDVRDKLELADYYVSQKRIDQAEALLEPLRKDTVASAAAGARLAGLRYARGQVREAHTLITELLAKSPNDEQLLVIEGRWFLAEKKIAEAQARAQSAINANPRFSPGHALQAGVHDAKRETEQAIAAWKEVLTLTPSDATARVELARLHLGVGRSTEAEQFAREAVKLAPTNGAARVVLVRALLALNQVDAANAEVGPLTAADVSDQSVVQTLLGDVLRRRGDRAGARRALTRALELEPGNVDALSGLVTLDIGAKQLPEAVRRVEAQVARTPDNGSLLLLTARTYATAGDFAKAEATLKRAIDVDPALFAAYNTLGQLYINQNRLDEARREFENVVTKRPRDVGARTMVAMLYQVRNEADKAKEQYEQILAIDPTATVAANNLAYMHAESGGNLDIALNLAQAAKASSPDDPDVNDTLGWVYYKRDLASMAISPLEQSVQRDPDNPTYLYHLGMAYLKAGDKAKARQALEKSVKLDSASSDAAEARKGLASLGQ